MKQKQKITNKMIDEILKKYYQNIDQEYYGFESIKNESQLNYHIYFLVTYEGKDSLILLPLDKNSFKCLLENAISKVNGYLFPSVNIIDRENALGYSVEYEKPLKKVRKKI